ncbi:MAG: DNA polymerase I [Clostridia bacterium]|nr:DNA polymerase I [Clostridia bacterium]
MKEKFIIIDGNSLANRAFWGMPYLKSLSGKPCNAIFGFLKMILNLIMNEKPKYFACVFDASKHNFRHDMYADYKGKRDKMPEDLRVQLADLKIVLKEMGICTIEKDEIEADDIIGTLTRKFDAEFILVSGDKDLLQLINTDTTVWLNKKGITDVLKVDIPTLKAEFGIEPYQVIELKSIMGDSSDNIPGVPGIGKIGATKLIEQYKDLDNIYTNIDNISGSTKTKLLINKDMAYLSKQLATIKLDVDLDITLQDCEYKLPFNEVAYDSLLDLGFNSILSKQEFFKKPQNTNQTQQEDIKISAEKIEVDTQQKFEEMISSLSGNFSVLTDNLTMILSNREKEFILYPSGELFAENVLKIKQLFENENQKICFDAKQIMNELFLYNIDILNYFDVSIAIYIANEMDAEISLDDALKLNKIITESKASALFKLKEIYISKLISTQQLKLFSEVELPLVKVLFDMEKQGIKIDVDQLKQLSETYHCELKNLTQRIYDLAGEEFNINSPKQLQVVLFEKLNLQFKGKPSTSIEVLNAIKDQHDIVEYIIRYRKISKLISTYLDGMLNYVSADGKIHTTFMQRTTSTGRLSSREPNLQNLPIRDDEGKLLRKMFSSSFENGTMISADYNQIELRLIANFSGDESMTEDYLSGKDIHTVTASKIFDVPIEFVDSGMRRVAKSVNFGIIYGISAYGLSQNINKSPKESKAFIEKYMQIYPKVKDYGQHNIEFARANGYVSTYMGRIRHINDINSSNHTVRGFAERTAMNMPLQGSASDFIKMAMIKVYNRIKQENLKSKLILQIHDELIVDCYPGENEVVKNILKQEMESVVNLKVPLIAEVSEGITLYDAK